ncbi:MAG: molybdate ABC transporter substrate-binding protein [Alphaproteobacteria bacterium]|nr:molybdate ABC transporter substrate-binding protein [Alphaproteobacteria bacterium]
MRNCRIGRWAASLAAIAFAMLTQSAEARAETVLVAVAANFVDALKQVAKAFEAETGHTLKYSAGSTGQLYAQIKNGAPFDVFLAADDERPRLLETEGDAVAGSRFTYGQGQLVWWNPKSIDNCSYGTPCQPRGMKSFAIANPNLAPYGRAAEQVLRTRSDWQELKPKLVFGQNIAQTFAMIATGNADAGIVSRAQIDPAADNAKGSAALIDPNLHDPIRQDAVLLTRAATNPAASAFMTFLKSPSARKIIAGFGYLDGND